MTEIILLFQLQGGNLTGAAENIQVAVSLSGQFYFILTLLHFDM